jgi:ribonuclease HII
MIERTLERTSRGPAAAKGAGTRPVPARSSVPTLRTERSLLRSGHRFVLGMDEVGRGALAGPVSVGVVLVEDRTRSAPVGLRDSKLLTPAARDALAPRLRRWAARWAVGHSSPVEIDAIGIIAALRLAGRRAIEQLDVDPSVVILDGNHDWLSTPAGGTDPAQTVLPLGPAVPERRPDPAVLTMVKADLRCAAVAAASVLAKTTRDAMMTDLARVHPRYRWDLNKGYSAPEHIEAIGTHGACPHHRLSWRLPGMMGLHPWQTSIPVPFGEPEPGGAADAAGAAPSDPARPDPARPDPARTATEEGAA